MPVKRKKPKKTKLLSKDEKKALLDMLNGLLSNYSEVASTVMEESRKRTI